MTCEKRPEGSVGAFQAEGTMKVMAQSRDMAWHSLGPETGISGAGCVEK